MLWNGVASRLVQNGVHTFSRWKISLRSQICCEMLELFFSRRNIICFPGVVTGHGLILRIFYDFLPREICLLCCACRYTVLLFLLLGLCFPTTVYHLSILKFGSGLGRSGFANRDASLWFLSFYSSNCEIKWYDSTDFWFSPLDQNWLNGPEFNI
jgi:hypothetical protein